MEEDVYIMIFLMLVIGLLVIDPLGLAEDEYWEGSELHAADRYAVAERIICRQALCW